MSDQATSKPEASEQHAGGTESAFEPVVARGRRAETPFLLVGGTALVVWSVVALVAGAVLVVWWLV